MKHSGYTVNVSDFSVLEDYLETKQTTLAEFAADIIVKKYGTDNLCELENQGFFKRFPLSHDYLLRFPRLLAVRLEKVGNEIVNKFSDYIQSGNSGLARVKESCKVFIKNLIDWANSANYLNMDPATARKVCVNSFMDGESANHKVVSPCVLFLCGILQDLLTSLCLNLDEVFADFIELLFKYFPTEQNLNPKKRTSSEITNLTFNNGGGMKLSNYVIALISESGRIYHFTPNTEEELVLALVNSGVKPPINVLDISFMNQGTDHNLFTKYGSTDELPDIDYWYDGLTVRFSDNGGAVWTLIVVEDK